MSSVRVIKLDPLTFEAVVESETTTRHKVSLAAAYYQKLAGGVVDEERLIEASFEFLLEREPNTAILGEFDLSVIPKYFPEFETEIMHFL